VLLETARRVHVQQSYRRFGHVQCLVPNGGSDPCQDHMPCIYDQLVWTERERPMRHSRFILWNDRHLKYRPVINLGKRYRHRHVEILGMALCCKVGYAA
jgi:hypothetical protein